MKDIQSKQPTSVYLLVTNDKYELPVSLGADTLKELSKITGFSYYELLNSLYHNYLVSRKYKVIKVDIREPESRFDYEDYKKYCWTNQIPVDSFKSLEQFKKYCYGEV